MGMVYPAPLIGARIYRSGLLSIANNTPTSVTFDVEGYDTNDMVDLSTDDIHITINTPGEYLLTGGVQWAHQNAGIRLCYVEVLRSGSTMYVAGNVSPFTTATMLLFQSASIQPNLLVGDVVRLRVHQNSGGALNLISDSSFKSVFLTAIMLQPTTDES